MIKAKVNKEPDCVCSGCGRERKAVLDMYDFRIGRPHASVQMTLCDECVGQLFQKSLKCQCLTNGRLKSKQDIAVIQKRNAQKSGRPGAYKLW